MRASDKRTEAGMVTAETAVVLPIVVAFVLALMWLIAAAVAEVRLVDAARDAGRAIARGDDESAVRAQVTETAPGGSQLTVVHHGAEVTVEVSASVEPPGWLLVPLPAIPLHASTTAQTERGSGGG